MKFPTFEEALADLASRMNMSPIRLLEEAMNARKKKDEYIEPSDEYIEQQCTLCDSGTLMCDHDWTYLGGHNELWICKKCGESKRK